MVGVSLGKGVDSGPLAMEMRKEGDQDEKIGLLDKYGVVPLPACGLWANQLRPRKVPYRAAPAAANIIVDTQALQTFLKLHL